MFLKLKPQAKSTGLFHKKTELVFQSIVCAVTLPSTVFPIPMKLRNAAHLATRARRSRGNPCVDCTCPLTSAGPLESVGGRARSLASERQQENVLTAESAGFRNAMGECLVCACVPALSWKQENLATACPWQLQPGS